MNDRPRMNPALGIALVITIIFAVACLIAASGA